MGRVAFIKDAQAAGFTLSHIGEILAIRDQGEAPGGHVSTLVEQRLPDVEPRPAELRGVRARLRDIAARSIELDPDDCDGYCGLIPQRETLIGRSADRPRSRSVS